MTAPAEVIVIPKDQYTESTLRCPGCRRWIGFDPKDVAEDGTLEVRCPYGARPKDDGRCEFKGKVRLDGWVKLYSFKGIKTTASEQSSESDD
ncbi:MAG: hypothetical protein DHS20C21_18090 [Gemmatimonadota bacterium]|nr:MAG: hypothetical protein DHS20C21_18090 [Gemmatimonadota bacterium]